MWKVPPDKSSANQAFTCKGRTDTLQERRMPKLKSLQGTGYCKDRQCDFRGVLPSGPKEKKEQAPEYFIEHACPVVSEPPSASHDVKLEPKAGRYNHTQRQYYQQSFEKMPINSFAHDTFIHGLGQKSMGRY